MQSEGFLCLGTLIFVYRFFNSRKIVGWHVGDSLGAIGSVQALDQALPCFSAVGSKTSCGLPVVELEQASEPLAGLDLAVRFADTIFHSRKEDHVPFTLMVSFRVKMRNVIRESVPERRLSKQDHSRQALGFH